MIRQDVRLRFNQWLPKYYDSPDFYTKFLFAQEKYPGESYYAAYLLPRLLSAAVTAGTLSVYIASVGPGLLAVSLGFILLFVIQGDVSKIGLYASLTLASTTIISNLSTLFQTVQEYYRLSTVRDFDVIHYVEHGKIVESGSHDELMARQGKYYKMFTTQAKKYYSSET